MQYPFFHWWTPQWIPYLAIVSGITVVKWVYIISVNNLSRGDVLLSVCRRLSSLFSTVATLAVIVTVSVQESIFSTSLPAFVIFFCIFLVIVLVTEVRCYLTMVLMYISIMAGDAAFFPIFFLKDVSSDSLSISQLTWLVLPPN